MINYLKKLVIFTVASLSLCACQTAIEETEYTSLSNQERLEKLNAVTDFEELGRTAIISDRLNKRFSVNSIYSYKKSNFSLSFVGPIGMEYAKIEVYANGTTYLHIQGNVIKGDNARELLKDEFNLDIPVEDLPSIIFGAPKGEVTYDENGYAKTAVYGDLYKVNYVRYQVYKGYVLPRTIEIISKKTKIIYSVSEVTRIK
ncbi:MAG: lipoprotein insertase outer membrane protein LolB [Succinivibrio sp.]